METTYRGTVSPGGYLYAGDKYFYVGEQYSGRFVHVNESGSIVEPSSESIQGKEFYTPTPEPTRKVEPIVDVQRERAVQDMKNALFKEQLLKQGTSYDKLGQPISKMPTSQTSIPKTQPNIIQQIIQPKETVLSKAIKNKEAETRKSVDLNKAIQSGDIQGYSGKVLSDKQVAKAELISKVEGYNKQQSIQPPKQYGEYLEPKTEKGKDILKQLQQDKPLMEQLPKPYEQVIAPPKPKTNIEQIKEVLSDKGLVGLQIYRPLEPTKPKTVISGEQILQAYDYSLRGAPEGIRLITGASIIREFIPTTPSDILIDEATLGTGYIFGAVSKGIKTGTETLGGFAGKTIKTTKLSTELILGG